MIPIIVSPENRHLLILVHGLNGSQDTWQGDNQRFVENLKQEQIIQDYFDVSLFVYGTRLSLFDSLKKSQRLFWGLFKDQPKEDIKGFNVGIDRISQDFEFEVRSIEDKYETISIIAHSMGGLVTKSALTWMSKEIRNKIYLVVSLSVPHLGSNLANIGAGLLGDNPQIIGLTAMGEFTTTLNHRYADLNPQPRILYQTGNQDVVVKEIAAVPPGVKKEDTAYTSDDHYSVVLIKDRTNNTLYQKILQDLFIVIQPFIGVNVGVAEGMPFQEYLELMARNLGIKVAFDGFTVGELSTPLREGSVAAATVQDFFFQVAALADRPLRKFDIKREKGTLNYVLKASL